MAKAKVVTKEREPKTSSFVRLTLTFEEAKTLRFVCSSIGGTNNTPRRDMTNIAAALDSIGIDTPAYDVHHRHNSIYFLEPDGSSFSDVFSSNRRYA